MSSAPALNSLERSISTRLALVFALRMFGLFIVLPILAPYAQSLPMGWGIEATPHNVGLAVGLAMGAYGLTQAFLYIPYGLLSDRVGRRSVVVVGLLIFAAGALWAARAETLVELVAARAVQGAGAISSVVVAMVADHTRAQVRTRAMAMVGMSIALTFALSLVAAPLLEAMVGMSGVFVLIAVLALLAIGLIVSIKPVPLPVPTASSMALLKAVLQDSAQWRLNIGVFVLHAVQMAMWVVIPQRLLDLHFTHVGSTWLYLAVIVLSMAAMIPLIIRAEKHHRMHQVMRAAIVLIVVSQIGLALNLVGAAGIAVSLLLFFIGFNVLEATQPSLLSKLTNPASKGAAAGVYNTVQALGLFVGALAGAWLNVAGGALALFACSALLAAAWLFLHERGRTQTD